MSTIVVVKKNCEICIGADTRTSFDGIREDRGRIVGNSKILKVGSSFIATVGHASWDLVLDNYFGSMKHIPNLYTRQSIYTVALEMHEALKQNFGLSPSSDADDAFESTGLHALIANPKGIFGLYSYRSVQEYETFSAFGSGSDFALGAMHVLYDDPDLDAKTIANRALEAAATYDTRTGGPFDIHVIPTRPVT